MKGLVYIAIGKWSRSIVVALLFSGTAVLAGWGQSGVAPDWTMTASMLSSPHQVCPVWVGIKNNGRKPLVACVRAFAFDIGEGTFRQARSRVSVHACRADEAFTLVRGGETHFIAEMIELPAVRDASTLIKLDLQLRYRDFATSGAMKDTSLEWKGTLAEITKAPGDLAH